MSDIQLHIGDLWEIGGERHFLDQVMGGGFLLFRSERTAAPYQILLDTGEQASPTRDWLKAQFAAGEARRLEHRPEATRARQIAAAREDDYDAIAARDPTALVRQIVLATLDRCGSYSRSDQGLRRAIAYVWEHKPRHLAGQVPPSPSTVRRWLNQRGRVGQRALRAMISMRGKVPRQKQISASVRRRMHREAVAYWADHSRTIANSYDDLARRLTTINKRLQHGGRPIVTIPAKETFRRYVRSLECYETVATKWGVAEAKKRFKACGEGLAAHRPLLLGTMDHTPADFHVVMDVDGWRSLGRPVLTILIDVHSRCVVGWVLSFEPPSLYSVTECIKRANQPKRHMLERFPDCRPLADIFGKFDEIVVDNGWEFTGTSFESAMTDVGTSVRWAPVRSPTHKAIVERFFGTLNERLNKRLPGGTFPVPLMRAWGLDPRKEAVLTLEQAEDLIEHAIGVYHQDIHTSLGEPPVAAWTRGVHAQGIQVIGDDLQLDKMIGAEVDRKLTRSGISLFGLDYHDPAVTGPLLEELAALEPMRSRRKGSATAKVKVKYNPADISRVHVWNHRRGVFDTLPCVDAEYAEGLTKWQHERIQEWQRETQSETEEERRELRCALRDKINALSSAKRINRLQRNQVRLLSSPMIQQLAGDHLRLEFAEPRHDGMAPVIATVPLALERTDGHAKPIRPARGGKRKAPANPPRSILSEPDTGAFVSFESSSDDWEEFQ